MALTGKTNEEKIWNFLSDKGFNDYAVAGIMGNLYAESLLKPKNLQDSYESSLGYTDASYTAAVDDGIYTEFGSDSAGYGLCQWTYKTRKANLLAYAKQKGKSIGDLEMQLEFLYKELTEDFTEVYSTLLTAASVLEASNVVLLEFEKPANQSETVQERRASYGQKYYDKYASTETETESETTVKVEAAKSKNADYSGSYTAKVKVNMRSGAGTDKEIICVIPRSETVKCYGYYTTVKNVNWYYVVYDGKTGFVCSIYLRKN